MPKRRLNSAGKRRGGLIVFCCLAAAILLGGAQIALGSEDVFESPEPVLLNEMGSTRALAASAESWRGGLPDTAHTSFAPNSRIVVFVSNVGLLPGEGANAFKVFATDGNGRHFRLIVEDVEPLGKRPGTFGLIVRVRDVSGYNGHPRGGDLALRVSWRGNTSNKLRLSMGKPGNEGLSDDGLTTAADFLAAGAGDLQRVSGYGDRKRLLDQATFGPTQALHFRLLQLGNRRWIEEQFNKPYPSIPYPDRPLMQFDANVVCGIYGTSPEVDRCHRDNYWPYTMQKWIVQDALYGDAQLRRRVSWALHQIWVVSARTIGPSRWLQEYVEILDRNAFGNYRDLMKEMTLSPAMGEYLDMVRSTRQNPNENYPRELLQLFTIGLYMLNQDGTYQLDGQGNRIPTYDQEKINQFTKVFTGWSQCNSGSNPACPNATIGAPNYIDPMHLMQAENHDTTAKSLLNYPGAQNAAIAACTNCNTYPPLIAYANDSLDRTLDNIFNHPNVGPFVGKLLIQHLVTSDPSPAYVSRVAAAFNNNGSGVRGDMKSVIRAILLDPEARGSRKTEPTYGKLREPLVYLTNFLRAFNVKQSAPRTIEGVLVNPPASCQGRSDGMLNWPLSQMGQDPLSPATVFSYFPPDYVVPGTAVLGPEFGVANTSTSVFRNNQMMAYSFGWDWFDQTTAANPYPWSPCGTGIDVSEAVSLMTADPTGNTLIENLNSRLMHGTMSEGMKTRLRNSINMNVSADLKARQIIFLVASSSQYQVQK